MLLAQLDLHHDHLGDYLKERLKTIYGPEWPSAVPAGSVHVEHHGSQLLERFEPTLLCADCNQADAAAKHQLSASIPQTFSFSPVEIPGFIMARPNQPHSLSMGRAVALWRAAEDNFRQRVRLADQLLQQICAGVLTCEKRGPRPDISSNDLSPLQHVWTAICRADGEPLARVQRSLDAIEHRSVARDGVASRRRLASLAPEGAPTDAEYAAYDGGGAPKLWEQAGPDWICPACERPRRAILRKSNNRARSWSGKIFKHVEYEFSNDKVLRHRIELICSDCSGILTGAKQRDAALRDSFLAPADIRAALTAVSPNAAHEIDWDRVKNLAQSNLARIEAVQTHWRTSPSIRLLSSALRQMRPTLWPNRGMAAAHCALCRAARGPR